MKKEKDKIRIPYKIKGKILNININIGSELRKIYGIGMSRINEIIKETGIRRIQSGKIMTEEDLESLERLLSDKMIRGRDRKMMEKDVRKKHRMRGTYKGTIRRRGLPVRGQRTSTNHKTGLKLNKIRGK